MGRLPPPDHDVFRRGDGEGRRHRAGRRPRHPPSARAHHGRAEEEEEIQVRHRHEGRRPQEALRRVQGQGAGSAGPALPRRSAGAALGRDRRRVQELAGPPRRFLSQDRGHSRGMGHRLQRAEHGLRQHGRRLGHRRGLQPQPGHRREQVLRRMARQCPGRRRGGRHPHPQPAQRSHQERAEQAPLLAGNRDARALQGAVRHPHEARAPLPRHAGHRVHDRGPEALHAPVPQRQADRHGGLEHGHGHAAREADRRSHGGDPRRAGPVGRAAAPDHRSGRREDAPRRSSPACRPDRAGPAARSSSPRPTRWKRPPRARR